MKKNYDYEKIEERVRSGMAGAERGLVYKKKQTEARPAENTGRRSVFGSIGMQVAGAFLAAAIVGGATFGALKYAEYRGSMIAPGSDPGIDSVYTEYGSVTSFYEDVQPAEPAENFTFRGVTVIDTDKVTEDKLKTDLPLDHYYVSVRGVISETAEKAGYEVFTYKLAAGEGVCVTKGGKLVFDHASRRDISRVPSRLIVADETPSGHGMIFFTRYSDNSGLYGGMTSVFAYDTVTGETAPVEVFLLDDDPVSAGIKSSPGAVGYYRNAGIGYDENTGFINYQETFDPIYADSTDRAGEALLSNPYRLGYINGKYVIGIPIEDDQPADTTLPSPDEPDKNVCFFKEVTVIDPAADGIVTDPDLPPQIEDDGTVAEIRNEHVSELGYGIYADGGRLIIVDKDGTGVVKVFGRGDELFPLIIAETDHRQPDGVTFGQLIVTEDKDTGKVTFIHTRFAMYSGLYGGTTLIEYFDTQTRETGAIQVYLPESAVEYVRSGGYLGTYKLAKLSAEDTANGKTIGCTCTVVPIGRGNNETQKDFFAGYLRYDNGNYYFGEPIEDQTPDSGSVEYDPAGKNSEEYVRVTSGDEAYYPFICPEGVIDVTEYEAPVFDYRGKLDIINNVKDRDWTVLNTSIFFPGIQSFDRTFAGMDLKQICSWIDSHETEMFRVIFTVTWDDPGDGNAKIYHVEFCVKKGAETTANPGTEFKGEYGLAVECDNGDAYPPVYASRVYKGAELISQKTDEAKAFICQISRDVGLNNLLPLHNNIRTRWAVISVEVGGERFESVALAEEWIKDRIRVSSSTAVNGFEITVTVTWDTVLNSDNTAALPADDRTEYSYRFTANYRIVHDTVPADERVLIEYADGKLRFTRIAAEPEFTIEKNGDMKASELDIHKLFAMLDGHDALDDPWDLDPSVTLRMMLDGETIYAFEMSYDGAVNVMRYHGSDRGFIASMKLTADEIKTLSGESGHDATETTAPAPETTAAPQQTEPAQTSEPADDTQQTEPVQTDAPDSYTEKLEAAATEIGGWLGGRLHEGMDLTELLGSIGDVKGDGLSLKKRWMAGDRIDSTAAGGTVRASAEEDAYYFLCITEEDPDARYPVIETRLIMYPGADGLELPFGLTPDTSAEGALQALGLSGFDGKASAAANGAKITVSGGADGVVITCVITDGDSFISAGFELGFGRSSQIYVEMSR